MERTLKKRKFSGTTDNLVQPYEIEHRKLARKAAAEGMVLLKNEKNLLPLTRNKKIALYGPGASKTIKGGTGSGDVNQREVISVYQGMKNAGFEITTDEWIADYEQKYEAARNSWKNDIFSRINDSSVYGLFFAYCETPFQMPVGKKISKTDTDTAVYVLSRIAGEGADRASTQGDYCLNFEEIEFLRSICDTYEKVILVINTGGLIDVSFLDEFQNIYSVLYIMQPGMEAGNAFADVITGNVVPCGKLTDTWAYNYEDYPNAQTFSHNNGDTANERYEEGIYVGYRYFDSFQVPARFGFGFGLSYTTFHISYNSLSIIEVSKKNPQVKISVTVTNTGDHYSGKEVVQIYGSCPIGTIEKEHRRLCGFAKTKELTPGESQTLDITFPVYQMASYDDKNHGWILEAGYYGIWIGNELANTNLVSMVNLMKEITLVHSTPICPLQEELKQLTLGLSDRTKRYEEWVQMALKENVYVVNLEPSEDWITRIDYADQKMNSEEIINFVDTLTEEQLIKLATGNPGKGQGSNLGSAGISIPGSAGETSDCAIEKNLASIVLADGPAGLRLNKTYQIDEKGIVPTPFEASIEDGFLCREKTEVRGTTYHQYCTAIPVGTLLAQTWNLELVTELGEMVGREMQEFGITLWLAPGMNIHRNPLCGRNFEYYSEDPLISGMMAAAMTIGVQKEAGCGTTIKHFACNNQEDNRMGSNSIVSERALREIYLKGFEIAINLSQPMAIMTSYNSINGIHAANSYDLCTKVARNEWGFNGIIMTDWTTTEHGPECTAAGCIRAGNDLIMPGAQIDYTSIKQELESGSLKQKDLKCCISRIVNVIYQSNQYEDAISYNSKM